MIMFIRSGTFIAVSVMVSQAIYAKDLNSQGYFVKLQGEQPGRISLAIIGNSAKPNLASLNCTNSQQAENIWSLDCRSKDDFNFRVEAFYSGTSARTVMLRGPDVPVISHAGGNNGLELDCQAPNLSASALCD